MDKKLYDQEIEDRNKIIFGMQKWREKFETAIVDEKSFKRFLYFTAIDDLYSKYIISSLPLSERLARFTEFTEEVKKLDAEYSILVGDPDYEEVSTIFANKINQLKEDKSQEFFHYLTELDSLIEKHLFSILSSTEIEQNLGEMKKNINRLDEDFAKELTEHAQYQDVKTRLESKVKILEAQMAKKQEEDQITNWLNETYANLANYKFETAGESALKDLLDIYQNQTFKTDYGKQTLKKHREFFADVVKNEQRLTVELRNAQADFDAFRSPQPDITHLEDASRKVQELLTQEINWVKLYALKRFQFQPIHQLKDNINAWAKYPLSGQESGNTPIRLVDNLLHYGTFFASLFSFLALMGALIWFGISSSRLGVVAPEPSQTNMPATQTPLLNLTETPTVTATTTEPGHSAPEKTDEATPTDSAEPTIPPTAPPSNDFPGSFDFARTICPYLKDEPENVFFDVPPLKITMAGNLSIDPADPGKLSDGSVLSTDLQVLIDDQPQAERGAFVQDPEELAKLTSGMCKISPPDTSTIYWIPAQFLTSEIAKKAADDNNGKQDYLLRAPYTTCEKGALIYCSDVLSYTKEYNLFLQFKDIKSNSKLFSITEPKVSTKTDRAWLSIKDVKEDGNGTPGKSVYGNNDKLQVWVVFGIKSPSSSEIYYAIRFDGRNRGLFWISSKLRENHFDPQKLPENVPLGDAPVID